MPYEKVLDQEMTPQEITDALKQTYIVVVSLGTIEQHGPHLPVGTDVIIPMTIAKFVGEKANVLVAPCFLR